MRLGQVLIGAGSIFTVAGVMAMFVVGPVITESLGLGILVLPFVGVVTTFAALFYVYRNQHLGRSGVIWVIAVGLFWFVLLPFFWFFKVIGRNHASST